MWPVVNLGQTIIVDQSRARRATGPAQPTQLIRTGPGPLPLRKNVAETAHDPNKPRPIIRGSQAHQVGDRCLALGARARTRGATVTSRRGRSSEQSVGAGPTCHPQTFARVCFVRARRLLPSHLLPSVFLPPPSSLAPSASFSATSNTQKKKLQRKKNQGNKNSSTRAKP
jgi:hypothetical protein